MGYEISFDLFDKEVIVTSDGKEIWLKLSDVANMTKQDIERIVEWKNNEIRLFLDSVEIEEMIRCINSRHGFYNYISKLDRDTLKNIISRGYIEGEIKEMVELCMAYKTNPFYKPKNKNTTKDYSGYVYLLHADTGYYKIGMSKVLEDRIKTLTTKMPAKIDLVYSFYSNNAHRDEQKLHKKFNKKRINGEWFDLTKEDVNYIVSIKGVQDGE